MGGGILARRLSHATPYSVPKNREQWVVYVISSRKPDAPTTHQWEQPVGTWTVVAVEAAFRGWGNAGILLQADQAIRSLSNIN
jgi:hypothetical protein